MILGVLAFALTCAMPAVASEWRSIYNGYGYAGEGPKQTLVLSPKASKHVDETHAALLLSKKTMARPIDNFKISLKFKLDSQLRKPAVTVNPWETLWLLFNYQPEGAFKKTNYLIVKSNGIEIGKAWDDRAQSFSYTAPEPRVKTAGWQKLTVMKVGSTFFVQLNHGRRHIIHIKGDSKLYSHPGSIGLYTEDARVTVKDVQVSEI